jgi:hypothetical protein
MSSGLNLSAQVLLGLVALVCSGEGCSCGSQPNTLEGALAFPIRGAGFGTEGNPFQDTVVQPSKGFVVALSENDFASWCTPYGTTFLPDGAELVPYNRGAVGFTGRLLRFGVGDAAGVRTGIRYEVDMTLDAYPSDAYPFTIGESVSGAVILTRVDSTHVAGQLTARIQVVDGGLDELSGDFDATSCPPLWPEGS